MRILNKLKKCLNYKILSEHWILAAAQNVSHKCSPKAARPWSLASPCNYPTGGLEKLHYDNFQVPNLAWGLGLRDGSACASSASKQNFCDFMKNNLLHVTLTAADLNSWATF